MKETLQNKAPFILAAAIAFFIYELYLLLNSFQAILEIYHAVSLSVANNGFTIRPVLWLFSELSGELGLIMRFAGALFFLVFAVSFVRKKPFLSYLMKGVLLEGIQYLFIIPFLTLWLVFPSSIASYEAAASYLLQLVLITPSFILLYTRLKQRGITQGTLKMTAIAATCFMFAMWAKHFFLCLYALPINFNNPVLLVGFVNSTVTLLVSALILTFAFLTIFRGKRYTFSFRIVGTALFLVGAYSAIYLLISTLNITYLSFLTLTELWLVSLLIAGLGFVLKDRRRKGISGA